MVMFCLRQEQKPKKEPTMKSIVKFASKGVDIQRLRNTGHWRWMPRRPSSLDIEGRLNQTNGYKHLTELRDALQREIQRVKENRREAVAA